MTNLCGASFTSHTYDQPTVASQIEHSLYNTPTRRNPNSHPPTHI